MTGTRSEYEIVRVRVARACVALWISSSLDTFRSVAPNWSSLGQAFAPKRNEEEKEEKEKTERRWDKGKWANRKDKIAGRDKSDEDSATKAKL